MMESKFNNVIVVCNIEHDIVRGVCAFCERDAILQEKNMLKGAVEWALGEGRDFPFPPRQPGEGPYWWRKELRRLTGLRGSK